MIEEQETQYSEYSESTVQYIRIRPESALLPDFSEFLQRQVANLQLLNLRPDFDDLHNSKTGP